MSNVNKVIIIGRLGRDPEVRYLEGGTAVAKLAVATTESYKDKSGEWQDQTEWHDVVLWRWLAERAERQLKKGSLVYVEGKLKHRKYQKDGEETARRISEVVAENFKALSKLESSSTGDFTTSQPNNFGGNNNSNTSATKPAPKVESIEEEPTDDLPF